MSNRCVAPVALFGCFGALLLPGAAAYASWPMARHDAKRVGAAIGTGNITTPVAYWRDYLGGAISGLQLLVTDVAGTGQQDLLLAASGKVIAKDPSDAIVWQSPAREITSIVGIADLDGDGVPDVIAQSADHVIILSVRTGNIEWTEPDGEMGTIGAVRVADVNGDGKPEVLVIECGSCGVISGNTGFYWSFAGGFASAIHVGSLPASTFLGGTYLSATLLQADVSPEYRTLVANYSQFFLLDGGGNILAQTAAVGSNVQFNQCMTGDIDGVPGNEAVCLLSYSPVSAPSAITVLHYDYEAQPPALDVLWSKVVEPAGGGDIRWVDPVADLDGDGLFEVVVSTNDPVNGWQTHIYDALSGTELVPPIAGQTISGTAALESTTGRLILTESGTTASAWAFARSPSPVVTARWSEPTFSVLAYPDRARVALESIGSQVLATDLDGDGLADAVMHGLSTPSSLVGFSGAGGTAKRVATLTLPANVDVLTSWIVPPVTIATPQVAMARSDGILNLLDEHLQPTSFGVNPVEVDVRVGGYYATGAWRELYNAPRLAAMGSGPAQSVIVDDSRSALLRLDAINASAAIPPTLVWQVTHTYGPTVAPGLNPSEPAMACLALTEPVTDPPQYRARVVNADGTLGWDQILEGNPLNDLAPGNFNGDSVPDFAIQLGSASTADLATIALSGSDGSLLWSTANLFPGYGGTLSPGISIGTFGSSVSDDLYYQGAGTFVLSGVDGTQVASGGSTTTYDLPMLLTNTSNQNEVLLNASYGPVSLYSADLQTALWVSPDSDDPYPYGAIAQCPSEPMLAEGSSKNPARLKLTPLGGTALGAFTSLVLAEGRSFPNEAAAKSAGVPFLGQLTSVNVQSNLTGQNHPSAVVGSSDGWLYSVNPCNGVLDFAVEIGASVGEAVFGDTDGDGNDEILVTAADGYLYDFKNLGTAAPSYVWDTDPPAITKHDVDTIQTTNQLSATWAAVTGATSYAVQVVTIDGQRVSTPLWQNVRNETSTSLPNLPLKDGSRYLFAVRAMGPNGPSVDAVSNGVTVHFPPGDGGANLQTEGGAVGGSDGGSDSGFDAGERSSVEAGQD